MPSCRSAFVALLLAAPSLLLPVSSTPAPARPAVPERPRLAVLIVFDQMRGDFPIRWQTLFAEGGFRRLASEGAWFQNCHYPYANTATGPGHATLSTGCTPDRHGIVSNEWQDRKEGKVNCVGTIRHTQLPPPIKSEEDKKDTLPVTASPERLLSPTFADSLRQASAASRIVALSLKDRSSVLPGGRKPTLCLWMDKHGRVVTSTYYADREPAWVRTFNASGFVDRWEGKCWDRLRHDLDYVRWAGPDDVAGEGTGKHQGRTFPHPIGTGPKKLRTDYHAAVANSPYGNDILLELARRAIDQEKLGQRGSADFLSISFSSNDIVGHTWGPDSQEVLDITLRSDLILRDLMKLFDDRVGKGRWVLAVSADHGICPLPEISRMKGLAARRVVYSKLVADLSQHLDNTFATTKADKGKTRWIETYVGGMLYFNRKRLAQSGLAPTAVEKAVAAWLRRHPAVQSVHPRSSLLGRRDSTDPIVQQVLRSFHPDRSGDVMIVFKPYSVPSGDTITGTTHGGPHPYDTHVPLLIIGPGIKPGIRKDRVSPEHAAVILARALGVPAPAHARVKVPDALFE